MVRLLSTTDWTIHTLCQFEVYAASGWSSKVDTIHNQRAYCLLVFYHFKVSFFFSRVSMNPVRLVSASKSNFFSDLLEAILFIRFIRIFSRILKNLKFLIYLYFTLNWIFRPLLSPFFWYRTFYHWNSSAFWSMDPLLLTFWLVSATGLDILNSLWLKSIVKGFFTFWLKRDLTINSRLLWRTNQANCENDHPQIRSQTRIKNKKPLINFCA